MAQPVTPDGLQVEAITGSACVIVDAPGTMHGSLESLECTR